MNPNIHETDKAFRERMQALIDEQTFEWVLQKTQEFGRLMSYYRCAMMEIETKFNVLNEEYSMRHDRNPISSIKTRLKSIQSIQGKLQRKNMEMSLSAIEWNIRDVAGVRVVCSFLEDVYTLADALLKQDDITLLERKDYIAYPKANGYRSLHLIVEVPIFLEDEKRLMKVEIQLRTIAMDCWASLEHQLRYKKERTFSEDMAEELYKCAQMSAELDASMDALRKNAESQAAGENGGEGKNLCL